MKYEGGIGVSVCDRTRRRAMFRRSCGDRTEGLETAFGALYARLVVRGPSRCAVMEQIGAFYPT
jgi:hypothetical protein